ncbi:hypothetical protein FISHEDRAFT_47943 [Fistulina hepatica ATCC 64428]|uniref:Sld7 C-terminal domain-containing protein n=1 Tax=Fistulina hepatica ATCC 64428 TaxID=1128425 RepID=A0A0D7A5B6_9AGAR|nr:hypothetical protein FISHEDRAFT_47943 [Fistulina hepatica ATCC 64428]
MESVPRISITNPTPTKPALGSEDALSTPGSKSKLAFRLLYRGALALPDSNMLLDGLTFFVRLDSLAGAPNLLKNQAALALESMRGIPSLRFMGTVPLSQIHMDSSGDIQLEIHPAATLSRIYFENTFCLTKFVNKAPHALPVSDVGIKVALGDSDGPETTHIVIFARESKTIGTIDLAVARMTTAPPTSAHLALPRPDDPTPRKPPAAAPLRQLKRAGSSSVLAFSGIIPGVTAKRPKLQATDSLKQLGGSARVPPTDGVDTSFKVPAMPASCKGKERQFVPDDDDVFETSAVTSRHAAATRADAIEKENKMVVRKAIGHHMSHGIAYGDPHSPPTPPIPKTHPEFKDIFLSVYRGVSFALRSQMKTRAVDKHRLEKVVKTHVGMYAPGLGE